VKLRTLLVLSATLLSSCWYEDRGYASCVTAHALTLEMRDRLACAAVHHSGYPAQLDAVLGSALDPVCGQRSVLLGSISGYATRVGPELVVHQHGWRYVSSAPRPGGTFGHYGLAVTDTHPQGRYTSYWVDDTGMLRSARGRAAGPRDDPEAWQTLAGTQDN